MAKSTTAQIRQIAGRLVDAAAARESDLTGLLRRATDDHGGRLTDASPIVRSKGAVRRTLEAKLECDRALTIDDVGGSVLDVMEYVLIVPDEQYPELIDDALNRLAGIGCDVLAVNNYFDWPTAHGIDAVVAVGAPGTSGLDATAPGTPGAFKMRIRFHTPESWEVQQGFEALYDTIRQLRHGSDRVASDFGAGEPVEAYYFADTYEDLGFTAENPAGLYMMLTTEDAQVALYLDPAGWKPSADVELWIATAEPSIVPIDEDMMTAVLAAWGADDAAVVEVDAQANAAPGAASETTPGGATVAER